VSYYQSKARPPHRGKITGQRRKAVLARVERRGPAQADGGGQTSVLDQRGVDLLAFVFIAQSLKEVGCPMVDAVRAKRRHQAVPAVLAFFELYHHRRLVSDPNVSDKEARSAANCMVLHPACHDDPVEFYNLHGFYPDNLRRK
jgi:hypothetical protein